MRSSVPKVIVLIPILLNKPSEDLASKPAIGVAVAIPIEPTPETVISPLTFKLLNVDNSIQVLA